MARLDYPAFDQMSDAFKELAGPAPLNAVRMAAHAEKPAIGFLGFGGTLLTESALDAKLRELVILRVSVLSGSPYETYQHTRMARKAGVDESKIAAVAEGPEASAFDPIERAVLQFTDAVYRQPKADGRSFDAVAAHLTPRELIELVFTIGFYMLVCRFLETLEIDMETDS